MFFFFFKWLLLLASVGFIACSTEKIISIDVDPINLSISSYPDAREGVPKKEYSFFPIVKNKNTELKFAWYFDDSIEPIYSYNLDPVVHTFAEDGLYFVTVRLYDSSLGDFLSQAILQVNIRSNPPEIPTQLIPVGTFVMGSERTDRESPPRLVKISTPFYMGETEITQSQFRRLMGYNPSWFQGDSLPVETLLWFDAVRFCNRLSLREGLNQCYEISGDDVRFDFTQNGWRLPTEMEWEYAARAGTAFDTDNGNLTFPYGVCSPVDPVLDDIAWYCGNSKEKTHPVAGKKPNSFGLYDMIGNVQEWCWDWYDQFYYRIGSSTDARGPESGILKSCRGSSWYNPGSECRAAFRFSLNPNVQDYNIGFRIVRNEK